MLPNPIAILGCEHSIRATKFVQRSYNVVWLHFITALIISGSRTQKQCCMVGHNQPVNVITRIGGDNRGDGATLQESLRSLPCLQWNSAFSKLVRKGGEGKRQNTIRGYTVFESIAPLHGFEFERGIYSKKVGVELRESNENRRGEGFERRGWRVSARAALLACPVLRFDPPSPLPQWYFPPSPPPSRHYKSTRPVSNRNRCHFSVATTIPSLHFLISCQSFFCLSQLLLLHFLSHRVLAKGRIFDDLYPAESCRFIPNSTCCLILEYHHYQHLM